MIRPAFTISAHLQLGENVTRSSQAAKSSVTRAGKIRRLRGDKAADNDDNRDKLCRRNSVENSALMMMSRICAVLMATIAVGLMLTAPRAHARWWGSRAPVDFEECADVAEKAATREAKAAALIECNAKFAGRRKPGGGYTYFDFMQNRSFDIAGPNPTPKEQKQIDEQYTEFLDRERQGNIAAAFAAKQQQQQLQQATFRSETEKAAVPARVPATNKPSVATGNTKRLKASACADHSFSCDWPQLSEKLNELKKALFGSSSPQNKRG